MQIQNIPTENLLEYARNPRRNDAVVDKMVACIKEFGFRIPIVAKSDGTVVDGHLRLKAARKMGLKEVPVVNADDLTEAQIKAFRLVANQSANWAEWDEELLKLEFKDLEDLNYDLELTGFDLEDIQKQLDELEGRIVEEDDFDEETETEKNPIAENYINKAWEKACGEILEQYKKLEGFSFYTPNISKINFIKFLFYGKRYPRSSSLAFHARQFRTKGCSLSLLEGLERIASSKIRAGYLRMLLYDDFPRLLKIHLPFSGARMPLDFPVDLARDLINEFGNNGKVLDPCAGWGGRLVGFLASTAVEYQGIDASPYQVQGDLAIYECYKDVVDENKKVSIICSPFEKFEIEKEYYDMALTSPPYFDVEIYEGGEQSSDYGSYEKWKDCFFSVLFSKVYKALKKKGIFCLQVGSQKYPLEKDGIQLACEVGFEHIESRGTKMINTKEKTEEENMERIVIFRKP